MPEGDSLYRLARELAPHLVGRKVVSITTRRLPREVEASLVGHRVVSVVAKGKNLLVEFDDERVLHVHLRMEGRIAVERERSKYWAPDRSTPDLRLAVDGASIIGRRLPVLRLLTGARLKRDPAIAGLGPDLTSAQWDEDEALARLRGLADREIGAALLVQHAIAGIGNVYKSEVLFLEGIDPKTLVSAIDDGKLRSILRRASALLRSNLGPGPRVTRAGLSGPRLWVYGRAGRPCLRCGTTVTMFHQPARPDGPGASNQAGVRSTYHCSRCQR